jgi:hypothetical protein
VGVNNTPTHSLRGVGLSSQEIPAIELMEDFGESEVAEASDCAPEEQQQEEQPAAIDAAAEDTAGVAASSSTSSVSAPRLVDGEKSRGKARWGQLRVRAALV